METYNRICIEDKVIKDNDRELQLERGKEYLTSRVDELGNVTVFSRYWAQNIPVTIFAGEKKFT